jgi:hypothetical protein
MEMDDEDPQKPLVALGVAILGLTLIADERMDNPREIAVRVLRTLAEKYGYTPENT